MEKRQKSLYQKLVDKRFIIAVMFIMGLIFSLSFIQAPLTRPIGDIRIELPTTPLIDKSGNLWDNWVTTDNDLKLDKIIDESASIYPAISIKNNFDLPLLSSTMMDAVLEKHTSSCGIDCMSEFEITTYQDSPLVTDVKFNKLVDNDDWVDSSIRSYQFYILSSSTPREVDDYTYICVDIGVYLNGSTQQECSKKVIGTHTEYDEEWLPYNYEVMPSGTYKVKLEGQKAPTQTIDWVMTSMGKEVSDWSTWSSLGNWVNGTYNLTTYFQFDETSGTSAFNIANGSKNGTLTNSPVFLLGKINNALNFSGNQYLNTSTPFMPAPGVGYPWSVNLWINSTMIGGDSYQVVWSSNNAMMIIYSDKLRFGFRGGGTQSVVYDINYATNWQGQWKDVVMTYNGGTVTDANSYQLYIDGTLYTTGKSMVNTAGTNTAHLIGIDDGLGGGYIYGKVDEFGVWNRVLNSSDVSSLYNSGSGLNYPFTGSSITLNSPIDNNISANPSITFNTTATVVGGATLVNMSLFDNSTGTWKRNQTQSLTGTTNTTTFTNTYTDKTVKWGVEACDSDGACGVSSNRIFTVDTTAPVVTILYPTGTINGLTNGQSLDLNYTATGSPANCWYNYEKNSFNGSYINISYLTFSKTPDNLYINYTDIGTNYITYIPTQNCSDIKINTSNSILGNTNKNFYCNNVIQTILGTINMHSFSPDSILDVLGSYNLNCSTNSTFNYIAEKNSIKIYANDSAGNLGSNVSTWGAPFIINSVTYTSLVQAGDLSNFIANITIDPLVYSSVTAYLNYNGTVYLMSTSDVGDNKLFIKSFVIPEITPNATFFFNYTLSKVPSGIEYFVSDLYIQSISLFKMDNCSVYDRKILNFIMIDEETLQNISGTLNLAVNFYSEDRSMIIGTYNDTRIYSGNTANPVSVCVANLTGNYSLDYTTQFYSNQSTYFIKYKSIQNFTLNNATSTQNITLYDLLYNNGNTFQIQVAGAGIVTSGLLVDIQKQYLAHNAFISTESYVTGADGFAVAHLTQSSAVYNFIVSKNGHVLGTFNNYQVKCNNVAIGDCIIILPLSQASISIPDFKSYGNIQGAYTLDKATRTLYFTFITTDGQAHQVDQQVKLLGTYSDTLICNSSTYGTSGTIICVVPSSFGDNNFQVDMMVHSIPNYLNWFIFSLGSEDLDFKGADIIMELLLYSTLALLFVSNPAFMIMGAILGMIFTVIIVSVGGASLFNVISIVIWYVAAGIIASARMGRRTAG